MDVINMAHQIFGREEEKSGAEKLLDLLQNPFASQVSKLRNGMTILLTGYSLRQLQLSLPLASR